MGLFKRKRETDRSIKIWHDYIADIIIGIGVTSTELENFYKQKFVLPKGLEKGKQKEFYRKHYGLPMKRKSVFKALEDYLSSKYNLVLWERAFPCGSSVISNVFVRRNSDEEGTERYLVRAGYTCQSGSLGPFEHGFSAVRIVHPEENVPVYYIGKTIILRGSCDHNTEEEYLKGILIRRENVPYEIYPSNFKKLEDILNEVKKDISDAKILFCEYIACSPDMGLPLRKREIR